MRVIRGQARGTNRPVFLDLRVLHFPIGAWVSIAHRISGVALVAGIFPGLWLMQRSLEGPAGFAAAREIVGGVGGRILLLGLLLAGFQHVLSGVRHLLLDLGVGEGREMARRSAWVVCCLTPLWILILWAL